MNEQVKVNWQANSDSVIGRLSVTVKLHAHAMANERKARNGRVVKNGFFEKAAILSVQVWHPCFYRYSGCCPEGEHFTVSVERLYEGDTVVEKADKVRVERRLGQGWAGVVVVETCERNAGGGL